MVAMAGRKRGRQEAPAENGETGAQQAQQEPAEDGKNGQARQRVDRRAEMADIARRRAQHFATFRDEDDEQDAGNVHAGGNEARTLGPWSSAVELVNAREQAAEARRQKVAKGGADEEEEEAAAGPHLSWKPGRDPKTPRLPPCPVRPLFELCIAMLVEHADCIDSLAGLPDVIRARLASAVCEAKLMTPEVAMLFARDAPGEVVLPTCVLLDPPALTELVAECATPKLEVLELGFCGRGFTDGTAGALAKAAHALPPVDTGPSTSKHAQASKGALNVRRLLLGGVYRLSDEGVEQVLGVTPHVEYLSITDGSRIDGAMLHNLRTLTPALRNLNLSGCRGITGATLSSNLPPLKSLTHLTLDGCVLVDDGVMSALGQGCSSLTHLSVTLCPAVTDTGVSALAATRPGLTSIRLDHCAKVTDRSLTALAAGCKGLKRLSVCRVSKITSAGLNAVAQNGCLEQLLASHVPGCDDSVMCTLVSHCKETLSDLDISFCRGVSDQGLGHLVDSCEQLQQVLLFGCSQITDRFAHGHGNEQLARTGGIKGFSTSVKGCD
uniref:F-box/LRR-repeat protein 15-like leucin rich repeat domain-containing protein n=1 Tax=Chlamydomonas leiostraca TaxID=1034604 RepID=A0A7S0WKY4_9CHLO